MLDNTITLPVDLLNNGTPTDQVFTRFREEPERTEYHGPTHTGAVQDILTLTRKSPVRNGNFLGAYRTKAVFTQSFDVTGYDGTTLKGIVANVSVEMTVPLGLTSAQVLTLRQRVIALLDQDIPMDRFNRLGEI